MTKNVKYYTILFGMLWGLSETVLGTILHILPLGSLSGYILFPIGFYCMLTLYKTTGRLSSIVYCGVIASLLKLSTLLFYSPALIFSVIKPAACIILEALVSAGVVVLLNQLLGFRQYYRTFATR